MAIATAMLCTNGVMASECVGEDCELTPIVIEQDVETTEFLEPKEYEIN